MHDKAHLWLSDAAKTTFAGKSLARTVHARPVTIFLRGELGAGKTTFLQGFGLGLGLKDAIHSPTYALEQRYETPHTPLLHLDLYRLTEADAAALVASTDDYSGIRCIEWSERLPKIPDVAHINIELSEENEGRRLAIEFNDAPLPTDKQIDEWRELVRLPKHVQQHCDTVAHCAKKLGESLLSNGVIVRPQMTWIAARIHDLLRFIDFKPGADPPGVVISPEDKKIHEHWKTVYAGKRHEDACTEFLKERGFTALADVVAVHGLTIPSPVRTLIEQQLLFYADKRVNGDKVVTLQERFDDFRKRYGHGKDSALALQWFAEAVAAENDLFPHGVPF